MNEEIDLSNYEHFVFAVVATEGQPIGFTDDGRPVKNKLSILHDLQHLLPDEDFTYQVLMFENRVIENNRKQIEFRFSAYRRDNYPKTKSEVLDLLKREIPFELNMGCTRIFGLP